MDPNKLLQEIVERARVIQHSEDPVAFGDVEELAAGILDLHDWLSQKGFLPAAWALEPGVQAGRVYEFDEVVKAMEAVRPVPTAGGLPVTEERHDGNVERRNGTQCMARVSQATRDVKSDQLVWADGVCALEQGHHGPHVA